MGEFRTRHGRMINYSIGREGERKKKAQRGRITLHYGLGGAQLGKVSGESRGTRYSPRGSKDVNGNQKGHWLNDLKSDAEGKRKKLKKIVPQKLDKTPVNPAKIKGMGPRSQKQSKKKKRERRSNKRISSNKTIPVPLLKQNEDKQKN